MANGNGNGSRMPQWLIPAMLAIMLGVLGYLAKDVLDLSAWKRGVDVHMRSYEATCSRMDVTLSVLRDHGDEIKTVHDRISAVRNDLSATRAEILAVIQSGTDDRFRGSDWRREKQLMEHRFDRLDQDVSRIQDLLEK